jgi:hypothetical protein
MITLASKVAHNLSLVATSADSVPSSNLVRITIVSTVFDMRLRVTFLRRKTVSLQSTLRTANKFWNGDNKWVYRVCFEKYWSLMKVRNRGLTRGLPIDNLCDGGPLFYLSSCQSRADDNPTTCAFTTGMSYWWNSRNNTIVCTF